MAVTRRPGLLALAVAILLAGCQDGTPESSGVTVPDELAGTADTVAYEPADGSYTLRLPSTWEFREPGSSLAASPPGQDTPSVHAYVVTIEQPLEDHLDEVVGDHDDARVPAVDVPGATDARLAERHWDDGGLRALLARSESGRVVAVTVLWFEDDDFGPQAAHAILDTLELHGDSEDPSPEAAAPSADHAGSAWTHTEEV